MLRLMSSTILGSGLAALLCSAGVVAAFHITGAKLNQSDSLPKGIYVPSSEPIKLGSIVFFHLPDEMRSYISTFPEAAASYDRPDNGILKPVVAIEGDVVCRDALTNMFTVNGRAIGAALLFGPSGAALPVWIGCQQLSADEIAVGSSRIVDSMDSRYFRTLNVSMVAPYRPWLTVPE